MPVIQMQGGADMSMFANALAGALYNQVGRFLDPTKATENNKLLDPAYWRDQNDVTKDAPGAPLMERILNMGKKTYYKIVNGQPQYVTSNAPPDASWTEAQPGTSALSLFPTPPIAPASQNPNQGMMPTMMGGAGQNNPQDMLRSILPALMQAMKSHIPMPSGVSSNPYPVMHSGGAMDSLKTLMQLDRGEVPAILEQGEVVINKNAANAIGPQNLDNLNSMFPRYHEGDPVQGQGQDPNQGKSPAQITVEAIQQFFSSQGAGGQLLNGRMPYPPPQPFKGDYPQTRPDPRAENPDPILTIPKIEYMNHQNDYTFLGFSGGGETGMDPNQPVFVMKRPSYQPDSRMKKDTPPSPPPGPQPQPAPAKSTPAPQDIKKGERVATDQAPGFQLPPDTTFPQSQVAPGQPPARMPGITPTPLGNAPALDLNAASKLDSGQLQQYLYDMARATQRSPEDKMKGPGAVMELYGQMLEQATGADLRRAQTEEAKTNTVHQTIVNNFDTMTAQTRANVLGAELNKTQMDNAFTRYLYTNKAYTEATLQKPIMEYLDLSARRKVYEAQAYYYMARGGAAGSLRGDQGAVNAMKGLLMAQQKDMELKEKMAQSGKFPGDSMMKQYLISALKYSFMINPQSMTTRTPKEISQDYLKKIKLLTGKEYFLSDQDVSNVINEVSANTAYMGLYQKIGGIPPEAMGAQPQQQTPDLSSQLLDNVGIGQ